MKRKTYPGMLGIAATLLPAAAPVAADSQPTCETAAASTLVTTADTSPAPKEQTMATHPYVGMWVTDDGNIRHELLPNGRYDEARGRRQSAYQGRYEITGTHIEYWDDTGFTADGDFVDQNTLHHGGMIFRRR